MSFDRKPLLGAMAGVLALTLGVVSASAQVQSGGIGDVDPFGRGYLEDDETAMPTDMWKASRTDDLLPLMQKVRTSSLTPAERSLLRRVVLSPAARPAGEGADQVLAQRARIMYEIGEAEAAADLLGRLEENPTGLDAEALSVDLQLALGNNATACRRGEGRALDGAFWAKLRTVCALLQGDNAGAELAAELAGAQGVEDDWFYNTVFAVTTGEEEAKPDARYDTGLNLAISEAASLVPGNTLVTSGRADLSAAMARRESLPISLRVQAAGIAAEAGIVGAEEHLALFDALLSQTDYQASRPIEVAIKPPASRVMPATAETSETEEATPPVDSDAENGDHAGADNTAPVRMIPAAPAVHGLYLANALNGASGEAARFAAVSRLLLPSLKALQKDASTAEHGLIFARAAIAAGDPDLASVWHGVRTTEEAPEPDAFELAWTEGLILLARGEFNRQDALPIADAIAEAADSTGKQRAAGQLFAAWTAMDIASSAGARAMMVGLEAPEAQLNPWDLLSIGAAAEADGAGEVVLSVIGLTGGDPAQLAPLDLMILIDALRDINADDAARTLALEATGYWKAIR